MTKKDCEIIARVIERATWDWDSWPTKRAQEMRARIARDLADAMLKAIEKDKFLRWCGVRDQAG